MYDLPFEIDLNGKSVEITGAGGIICGEFAKALAACGAKVALLDINYDAAKKVAEEIGLIPEINFRYSSTYFNHIFGGSGYNSGYYGYLWAEVLDKDAFSIFEASPEGVWNIDLAHKFKQTFLEKGGSEEPMVLYKSFAGREPNSDAMLRGRGLID